LLLLLYYLYDASVVAAVFLAVWCLLTFIITYGATSLFYDRFYCYFMCYLCFISIFFFVFVFVTISFVITSTTVLLVYMCAPFSSLPTPPPPAGAQRGPEARGLSCWFLDVLLFHVFVCLVTKTNTQQTIINKSK